MQETWHAHITLDWYFDTLKIKATNIKYRLSDMSSCLDARFFLVKKLQTVATTRISPQNYSQILRQLQQATQPQRTLESKRSFIEIQTNWMSNPQRKWSQTTACSRTVVYNHGSSTLDKVSLFFVGWVLRKWLQIHISFGELKGEEKTLESSPFREALLYNPNAMGLVYSPAFTIHLPYI